MSSFSPFVARQIDRDEGAKASLRVGDKKIDQIEGTVAAWP